MVETLTDEKIRFSSITASFDPGAYLSDVQVPLLVQMPVPAWLSETQKQLEAMLSMQDNWDGYGAEGPSREVVLSTVGFLNTVNAFLRTLRPHVSPSRVGGVLIEWENGCHELEVELVSPHAASFVYENTETGANVSGTVYPEESDPELSDVPTFLHLLKEFFVARP